MFSISLIIPAYNEQEGIQFAIEENLKILNTFNINHEIVVINDGSKDNTENIIQGAISCYQNIRLYSKKNGGFGSAIKYGVEKAKYEYILCVPVDSPLTKDVFQQFYNNFEKADVLVGYRIKRLGYTLRMKLNSWVFHQLVSTLFGMKLKDYNWIHAYRKSIFDKINIEYFGIFMLSEVLIKAKRTGCSIKEFPVEMIKRSGGVATAGSWKAVCKTFSDMIKFYFSNK